MAFTITTLSMFRHTRDFEKMHHVIIVECGFVNKLDSGVVNLAQIHEHMIQRFAGNPPTLLPHYHWWHFYKVRASAVWVIRNGHKVSPLLLGNYGYDARDPECRMATTPTTQYPSICNAVCHLFLCFGNGAATLRQISLENLVVGWAFEFLGTWKCDWGMGGLGIVPKRQCWDMASPRGGKWYVGVAIYVRTNDRVF